MVARDARIEKIREWRIVTAIFFPISFLFVFIAYFMAYIFKDKILDLTPYVTTYLIGFVAGCFMTEKITKFSEWLTHAKDQPNMRKWFLTGWILAYFIAISISYVYATLYEISYKLDNWLIGWGLLFSATTFMGFFGGSGFYIYKKTGEALNEF
ncbi:hypothetical protein Ferp_1884 [Ferroglobus placidus DSM 10642]|uniref:Uncharacterized protein n=1 Tax=Ferroglobus placidus (strain DSM 10642 / AEDII12DO) TaxID=589924 RepID=D3RZW1_FERPA|nr:hypothetical protein [Ferroglobus placidus]ADC66024.1 hypothetical protein Ferp_1884 [Ferroglobus placidus DSM 10642]